MRVSKKLLYRARKLRKDDTTAENRLWHHLRGRRFENYKFRRQHPVANYIVDFVCIWKKLIIELDGDQHAEQEDYDKKRTAYLQTVGYKVIRFWNGEVLVETEYVLSAIWDALTNAEEAA